MERVVNNLSAPFFAAGLQLFCTNHVERTNLRCSIVKRSNDAKHAHQTTHNTSITAKYALMCWFLYYYFRIDALTNLSDKWRTQASTRRCAVLGRWLPRILPCFAGVCAAQRATTANVLLSQPVCRINPYGNDVVSTFGVLRLCSKSAHKVSLL
jgi:hypothetical protein